MITTIKILHSTTVLTTHFLKVKVPFHNCFVFGGHEAGHEEFPLLRVRLNSVTVEHCLPVLQGSRVFHALNIKKYKLSITQQRADLKRQLMNQPPTPKHNERLALLTQVLIVLKPLRFKV